jgi:hypothetical protein
MVSGSIGPALMIFQNDYEEDDIKEIPPTGAYWGISSRVAADLQLDLSCRSAITFGIEYHWAQLSKRDWGTDYRYSQPMYGPALRVGLWIF